MQHKEKLFTAYVRLPQLDVQEFEGLNAIFLLKNAYDVAMAALKEARDNLKMSRDSFDISNKKAQALLLKKVPETREYVHLKPRRPSFGSFQLIVKYSTMMGGDMPKDEPIKQTIKMTEDEKKEWEINRNKEIGLADLELRLAISNVERRESALEQAEVDVKEVAKRIDADLKEKKKSEGDSPDLSEALTTTETERDALLRLMNRLASIKSFDWGPRSAHVIYKKYTLMKVLWASLRLEHVDEPGERRGEEFDLVTTFFETMQAKLEARKLGEEEDPRRQQMRKVAGYVV